MSVTDSETIGLRLQVADTVLTTIDAYSDTVADGYNRFLMPEGTQDDVSFDGAIFDARSQIALLRQRVARGRERLKTVHADVVLNLRGGDGASHEVATLSATLTEKFRAVRHTLKGLLSAHSLGLLGVTGRIPETPWRLHRKVCFVQAGLRNPDLVLDGVLRMPEGGLTPAQMADQLEGEASALGKVLEARRLGGRETVAGRAERAAAVKDFDREVRLVIRIFAALARAAGREDLAAQIAPIFRLGTRRAKRTRTEEVPSSEMAAPSETLASSEMSSSFGTLSSSETPGSPTSLIPPLSQREKDPLTGRLKPDGLGLPDTPVPSQDPRQLFANDGAPP